MGSGKKLDRGLTEWPSAVPGRSGLAGLGLLWSGSRDTLREKDGIPAKLWRLREVFDMSACGEGVGDLRSLLYGGGSRMERGVGDAVRPELRGRNCEEKRLADLIVGGAGETDWSLENGTVDAGRDVRGGPVALRNWLGLGLGL